MLPICNLKTDIVLKDFVPAPQDTPTPQTMGLIGTYYRTIVGGATGAMFQ